MRYYVFPFSFKAPVHFGNTSDGGTLEKVQITISSDTLFSAMVNEIGYNTDEVSWLVEAVCQNKIKVSSLHPFIDTKEEMQLFLPKPMLKRTDVYEEITNRKLSCEKAKEYKKIKRISHVRTSDLHGSNSKFDPKSVKEQPYFGQFMTAQRVNLREEQRLPYVVGSYTFKEGAGLYCIVGVENADDVQRIRCIFESLGLTGIGGKRSSGYGQFIVKSEIDLENLSDKSEDQHALLHLLHQQGNLYMSLSAVTPKEKEVSCLSKGTYKLIRRSGFVYSESISAPYKRNSFYALQEGSCMPYPLEGQMVELCSEKSPHPIYKNMKGFWLGVNIDE